jgi:hypothetical protein
MVAAQVRGQSTVQSNGFSVAALPDGVSATYVGLAAPNPPWLGIVVSLALTSDSGSILDLDQVQWAENVQVTESNGSLVGLKMKTSGYLTAVFDAGAATDTHATNMTRIALTQADITSLQYMMFLDLRTGVANVPFEYSGYTIYQLLSGSVGSTYTMTISQTGTVVSIGSATVLPGATSPVSPITVTQTAVQQ